MLGLFRVKKWPVVDLTIFKWTTALFGIMIGAYFSDFVKQHIVTIAILAALGAIRVCYFYYFKKDQS
jgi:putative Mn2+ efflux pump MntP